MVFWTEIDKDRVETIMFGKDRLKFRYSDGPLRFQIPRGLCTWGVSAYKSLQVDLSNQEFVDWWRDLETRLCPQEPFNSNLKGNSIRLKIDDATYIFDENAVQVSPEVREGLFRGQELSCLIDVDATYFFNGNWGLTVRVYQVRTYGGGAAAPCETARESVLVKGICAFLE
jgi:hypothetical protein